MEILFKDRIWFRPWIASAYNTHYFRNDGKPYIPPLWKDELKKIRKIPDERFTENAYKTGSPGVSKITDGGGISQGQPDKVPHPDLSTRARDIYRRSTAKIAISYTIFATRLRDRVFSGAYKGGKWECASSGAGGGLPAGGGNSPALEQPDGCNQGRYQCTVRYPAGPEVEVVLPRNDQAAENQPVQFEPGMALADLYLQLLF